MSTSTSSTSTATVESILAAIAAVKQAIQDPLAAWMLSKGFDPARGCYLILPDTDECRQAIGPMPPHYVRFNRFAREVYMIDPFAVQP